MTWRLRRSRPNLAGPVFETGEVVPSTPAAGLVPTGLADRDQAAFVVEQPVRPILGGQLLGDRDCQQPPDPPRGQRRLAGVVPIRLTPDGDELGDLNEQRRTFLEL